MNQPPTIIHPPEWAGKVVDIINYNGRIYVACEFGIFWLDNDGVLQPIKWSNS